MVKRGNKIAEAVRFYYRISHQNDNRSLCLFCGPWQQGRAPNYDSLVNAIFE